MPGCTALRLQRLITVMGLRLLVTHAFYAGHGLFYGAADGCYVHFAARVTRLRTCTRTFRHFAFGCFTFTGCLRYPVLLLRCPFTFYVLHHAARDYAHTRLYAVGYYAVYTFTFVPVTTVCSPATLPPRFGDPIYTVYAD